MSNMISRRSFLRTASAAALLATASVLLTGCNSRKIVISFYDGDTATLLETKSVKVDLKATTVAWKDLASVLPVGYKALAETQTGAIEIGANDTISIKLPKKTIEVVFKDEVGKNIPGTLDVLPDATSVTRDALEKLLDSTLSMNYDLKGDSDTFKIEDGKVEAEIVQASTAA